MDERRQGKERLWDTINSPIEAGPDWFVTVSSAGRSEVFGSSTEPFAGAGVEVMTIACSTASNVDRRESIRPLKTDC
jgi:hypothetical protein